MKKIVVAADSFKGSLTSSQVAQAVENGVRRIFPETRVVKALIADGGEGTVDALVATLDGQFIEVDAHDPLMRPVKAHYGIVNGTTAVIEMASASGLTLLAPAERNPSHTTTYGTGELILDALRRGCRELLVGIGGSATNDAGTGMLRALGFRFPDSSGSDTGGTGGDLAAIASIDRSGAVPELAGALFTVACDVTAPFCGPDGAAFVFAPQKGADPEMVRELDAGLEHFAEILERDTGVDLRLLAGAGAAGGMGGGMTALLGAQLVPGIDMVLRALDFDAMIRGADLVITGEGRIDAQTALGKAPRGILDAASRYGIPVIAIGGSVDEAGEESDFTAVFPILPCPATLERAMEPSFAAANVERTVARILKIIKTFR